MIGLETQLRFETMLASGDMIKLSIAIQLIQSLSGTDP